MSQNQAVPRLDTPLTQDGVGQTSNGAPLTFKGAPISIPWYRFMITLWNRTGGSSGGSGVAIGCQFVWAGQITAIPNNLLLCNGAAVSREQYAELFAVIGTTYGSGDGRTTFNLPNLEDRVVLGAGTHPIGETGGTNSLVLTQDQLPPVSPGVNDSGHVHGQMIASTATGQGTAGTMGANAANDTTVGDTASATTGITIDQLGTGAPIDITPAFISQPWVIQATT